MQLTRRTDIDVFIIAAQQPLLLGMNKSERPIRSRPAPRYSCKVLAISLETRKPTVEPPTNVTTQDRDSIRQRIRKLKITLHLRFENSADSAKQWRSLCRPGFEVHNVFSFGNKNESLPQPCDSFSNGVLLDPQCLPELKLDPAEAENIWCISCLTPPLGCRENLVRGERKEFVATLCRAQARNSASSRLWTRTSPTSLP